MNSARIHSTETSSIMNEDDYHKLAKKKLTGLRHFERCIFSAWCCDQLLALDRTPADESDSLQSILNEIWDVLLSGTIPEKALLNVLDDTFEESVADGFDDTDSVTCIGRSAVGMLILGCRRNDVRLAVQCGEAVLKATLQALPSEILERTSRDCPEFHREIDNQIAMIKLLRGDFALDGQLRGTLRDST